MYDEFAKWLDRILDENMPLPGVAINFNIYEEVDLHWSIQLISSTYFDEEDEDWNCYEEFTTGEDLYEWQQGVGWEKILDISCEMIRKYLTEGNMLRNLRSTRLLPLDSWTAMWKSCTEDRVLWKLVCSRKLKI